MQPLEIEHEFDRPSLSNRRNAPLDEVQRSWLLRPTVDLGNRNYTHKNTLKWTLLSILTAFTIIGLPIIIKSSAPNHYLAPSTPDNYTIALHKALIFFNAQKSGKLPNNNGIEWRGDSSLLDGSNVRGGLVGGYYDAGDDSKFHFPMAYSMTMLSWSVIEYRHKYEAIGEYEHVREVIKWGTDYLLLTFNSSATDITSLYSQVSRSANGSAATASYYMCWTRPEDIHEPRPAQISSSAPELAGEIAAALAAASVVFLDDADYSRKLVRGARTVFEFARAEGRSSSYSLGNPSIEPYYNSTDYHDELIWGSAWLFYATGDYDYLSYATTNKLAEDANAFQRTPGLRVLSWDNKLPAAMLLLTRMRLFLSPGYPYEETLRRYHVATGLTVCSYLERYRFFNRTKGGLIQLNHVGARDLGLAANAAFVASVFADYLNATDAPGWYCGGDFLRTDVLKQFATSQMEYILGANPMNTSYVVGYGAKFPRHVYHRGASIPPNTNDSCREGFRWLYAETPNPNNITGAMVGGPDRFDKFEDVRSNFSYTEPSLAANAGLVAALVSLTSSGGFGVEKNAIFSSVPPLYPNSPPPPPPWKP